MTEDRGRSGPGPAHEGVGRKPAAARRTAAAARQKVAAWPADIAERRPEPLAERPTIPDYGVPDTDEGLLPWAWAEQRLRDALTYWISTVRPDGRPHAAPVWAVWLDRRLWFEGGLRTRRARNLAADPRAVAAVHVDDATALIVEGVVEERTDPDAALAARLVEAYGKYRDTSWAYAADAANWRSGSGGALWALRPTVVLGWSRFPGDATRWRLEPKRGDESPRLTGRQGTGSRPASVR